MNRLLSDISALYRFTQKYLDKYLAPFSIGSGQFLFLLMINENNGITMQKLTELGEFDKGTISKTIQKLVDEDYVQVSISVQDKRVKQLYMTQKGTLLMPKLYQIRNACVSQILYGLDEGQSTKLIENMADNSKVFLEEDEEIKFAGIQKLSLLDYPNEMACTLFSSGCNFKCPFCHNKDLVYVPADIRYLNKDDIFAFLNKRKGVLKAVCITGGEPMLHSGLLTFIQEIKEAGYLVKLDTNGYYPDALEKVLHTGLVDYVAMDIKNAPDKYALTVGLKDIDFKIEPILKSVELIRNLAKDYEFRTTIVKELHDEKDIQLIAKWLSGARRYSLQYFKESDGTIEKGFHAHDEKSMQYFKSILEETILNVQIKGGE
ncbi:MAG: anaerobic ribonucleoside-triphosphate reductase activating protein [Erysipelotrichaceae bacterium]